MDADPLRGCLPFLLPSWDRVRHLRAAGTKNDCSPYPTVRLSVWVSHIYLSSMCHHPSTICLSAYQQHCDCQAVAQYAGFSPSKYMVVLTLFTSFKSMCHETCSGQCNVSVGEIRRFQGEDCFSEPCTVAQALCPMPLRPGLSQLATCLSEGKTKGSSPTCPTPAPSDPAA